MSAVAIAINSFHSPVRLLSDSGLLSKAACRDERIYTLSARTALPAWVEPTASQIADLLALPPNWDSYGARPIRADRAQALWEVLVQVMAPQSPAPALVPVVDGSLQAEWHTRGVDLEIEATGPSSVRVYCRRDGVEWEDEISVDLSDLVEAIDAVTP